MDSRELVRPNELGVALWFVTYLYLDHNALVVSKNTLYRMQEGSTRFVQYAPQTSKLRAVFQAVPSLVAIALDVARPSPTGTIVIDLESVGPEMTNTDIVVAEALPPSSHSP